MKIISNFKDYYDFKVGKYGVDPLVTYNRICSTEEGKKWYKTGVHKPMLNNEYHFQMFAICGVIYCYYLYKGVVYFGNDMSSMPDHVKRQWGRDNIAEEKKMAQLHGKKTDINEKEDCPVLLIRAHATFDWRGETVISVEYVADVKNPKLSDYNFGKCLDADTIFVAIANFLSREKPVIDTRTDRQKIVGKGFDERYSFRHRPK